MLFPVFKYLPEYVPKPSVQAGVVYSTIILLLYLNLSVG